MKQEQKQNTEEIVQNIEGVMKFTFTPQFLYICRALYYDIDAKEAKRKKRLIRKIEKLLKNETNQVAMLTIMAVFVDFMYSNRELIEKIDQSFEELQILKKET